MSEPNKEEEEITENDNPENPELNEVFIAWIFCVAKFIRVSFTGTD